MRAPSFLRPIVQASLRIVSETPTQSDCSLWSSPSPRLLRLRALPSSLQSLDNSSSLGNSQSNG